MAGGYEYNRCRALGHAWDLIPNTRRAPWGKLLTFRCEHCTMIREDIVDQLFNLSSRRYIRPAGYKSEKQPRHQWMGQHVRQARRQGARKS